MKTWLSIGLLALILAWIPASRALMSSEWNFAINVAPIWVMIQIVVLAWHAEIASQFARSDRLLGVIRREQNKRPLSLPEGRGPTIGALFRDAKVDLFAKAKIRYSDASDWKVSLQTVAAWGALLYFLLVTLSMFEYAVDAAPPIIGPPGADASASALAPNQAQVEVAGGPRYLSVLSLFCPVGQVIYIAAQGFWMRSRANSIE